MKTYQPKAKDIKREWHIFDAKGRVLGRLATEAAKFLIGKHKVIYTPHLDMGDYVVIINAKDIVLTGAKMANKVYQSHSGHPGGFKEVKIQKVMDEMPTRIIEKAVYGMIPTNRLTAKRMARLKVYASSKHPYESRFIGENK